MISEPRTVRSPPPAALHDEPLAPVFLLEFAAAVAADALRAHLVAIERSFDPTQPDEVTATRALARECDDLVKSLADYRRRVLGLVARECERCEQLRSGQPAVLDVSEPT